MKYRQDELDVPKMAIACQKWLITGLAILSLARDTHTLIERSILAYLPLSVVLLTVEIEKSSVSDLNLSLVYDVLI